SRFGAFEVVLRLFFIQLLGGVSRQIFGIHRELSFVVVPASRKQIFHAMTRRARAFPCSSDHGGKAGVLQQLAEGEFEVVHGRKGKHRTLNIEHRTSTVEQVTCPRLRCSAFDVGCSMFVLFISPFHPFPSSTALRSGVSVCALDEKVQQVRIMAVTLMLRVLIFMLVPFSLWFGI